MKRFVYIIILMLGLPFTLYAQNTTPPIDISNPWATLNPDDGILTVYMSIDSDRAVIKAHTHLAATAHIASDQDQYEIVFSDFEAEPAIGDALNILLTFEGDDEDEAPVQAAVGVLISEEQPEAPSIIIQNAWARPTIAHTADLEEIEAPPVSPSAAYMTITNTNQEDDKLIDVSTDIAEIVEIHEVKMEDDVMRMRPVDGGIELPVDEAVALKPGGYHIMLMDLHRNLITGDAFTLTLYFESGEEITLAIPVYDAVELAMMDDHDMHNQHHNNND